MEANRDAAAQSLTVASRARQEGNLEKALKFVRKSIELFATPEAESLLKVVLDAAKAKEASDKAASTANAAAGGASRPPNAGQTSGGGGGAAAASSSNNTAAPLPVYSEMVKQILGASTLYEVLGVPWAAEETEMRKAYRKLAIQLHPDKNQSAGAEDAFKRVAEAVQTLTDRTKRFQYNMSVATKGPQRQSNAMPSRAPNWKPMPVPPQQPPRPPPPPPQGYPLPPGVPAQSSYQIECANCAAKLQARAAMLAPRPPPVRGLSLLT